MTTSKKALKLAAAARQAAELRSYQVDPDVVALRVERLRGWVDRLIWTGMILGLLFTMANVAAFASRGAEPWSLEWTTAWLLDPMVSLVLIGVLMGEQIINRHGLDAGGWVRTTKWTTLGCTYAMNTWSAWAAMDPAAILLHSVPPTIVFCAAEAVVQVRQRITDAVTVAYRQAIDRAEALRAAPAHADVPAEPVRTDADPDGADPRTEQPGKIRTTPAPAQPELSAQRAERDRAPRSADSARAAASDSASGNAEPVRTAAEVDRDVIVAELAAEILAAAAADEKWRPDYEALMDRTDRRRRWCEAVVRDAKDVALRTDDPQSAVRTDADDGSPRSTDSARATASESASGNAGQSASEPARLNGTAVLAGTAGAGGER